MKIIKKAVTTANLIFTKNKFNKLLIEELNISNPFLETQISVINEKRQVQFSVPIGTSPGIISFCGNNYFINDDYILQTGFFIINGKMRYFDPLTYKMDTNWIGQEGWNLVGELVIYLQDNQLANDKIYIDNLLYYFKNGRQQIGIITDEYNEHILLLPDGTPTGAVDFDTNTYFVGDNYTLESGFFQVNGVMRYFDPISYQMNKNWIGVDGWNTIKMLHLYITNNQLAHGIIHIRQIPHFFINGFLVEGIIDFEESTYYVDINGIVHSGFLLVDDLFRYFDPITYKMDPKWTGREGWNKVNSEVFYIKNNQFANGEIIINGLKYYFQNGHQQIGPQKVGNTYHNYLKSGGIEGWNKFNDIILYLHNNELADGELTIDHKKYYFNNGIQQIGLQKIEEDYYYFLPEGGVYSTGDLFTTPLGTTYLFSTDTGKALTGWQTVNGNNYYFLNDGVMAKNITIDIYTIDNNGISKKNPATLDNLNYYLKALLDQYGHTLTGAFNAVLATITYTQMDPPQTTEEGAIQVFNTGKGFFYQYAALAYELVNYLGYTALPITGIGRLGTQHSWLAVKYPDGWYYHDPLYRSERYSYNELVSMGFKWHKRELLTLAV
ncbi:transglutaminase domain-containing protein [Candidatus Epulonipiscium viviparus]|uniref:transglutaminase domain-containing protein n=1 Tax=Candidatus Epulonipiscium viviparus TaxID=420336 RepID=UPI00016C0D76|nr:transglutaminase domain-containing protein [Candidatus Epulopiscium viviparus]